MIRRRKRIKELRDELREARRDAVAVRREGREREPMLERLEARFSENDFLRRMVEGMEKTRRRAT